MKSTQNVKPLCTTMNQSSLFYLQLLKSVEKKKRNSVHTSRNSVNYRYQYPFVPDLSVVTASKNTN